MQSKDPMQLNLGTGPSGNFNHGKRRENALPGSSLSADG